MFGRRPQQVEGSRRKGVPSLFGEDLNKLRAPEEKESRTCSGEDLNKLRAPEERESRTCSGKTSTSCPSCSSPCWTSTGPGQGGLQEEWCPACCASPSACPAQSPVRSTRAAAGQCRTGLHPGDGPASGKAPRGQGRHLRLRSMSIQPRWTASEAGPARAGIGRDVSVIVDELAMTPPRYSARLGARDWLLCEFPPKCVPHQRVPCAVARPPGRTVRAHPFVQPPTCWCSPFAV